MSEGEREKGGKRERSFISTTSELRGDWKQKIAPVNVCIYTESVRVNLYVCFCTYVFARVSSLTFMGLDLSWLTGGTTILIKSGVI